jgi:hypothetical protein
MSQRESGYQRKLLDQYETPTWVTRALIPHLPQFTGKVWEPACGSGKMVAALQQAGFDVAGSDITRGVDFLGQAPETGVSAIITNPPYALAGFAHKAPLRESFLCKTSTFCAGDA